MRFRATIVSVLILGLIASDAAHAQTATGSIVGRATDATRAAIPSVKLEITNEETGLKHIFVTGAEGDYSAPALPAGNYRLIASISGFQQVLREVIVEAGTTTTADLLMQIGPSAASITVTGATPQLHYDSFEISGVTTRPVIDGVPLNGRDFLELAKVEPGAQQPTLGSNNRVFVPLLASPAGGNNGARTRVTADGGSIMQIGNGGTAMGFSQEVVQEFQVSTANFDLSIGMTASGSVNIATRSGGSEWHGSGFYFFRDHYLSAYPALKRDPFNPNPFFQRQQFGVEVGGPIRKKDLFVFGTFERNDQQGVISTELLTPEFVPLSRITPSPTDVDHLSVRVDWQANQHNSLFVRQSHEGGYSFAPTTVNGLGQLAYPSAWTQQPEWADQSILGWTSQFGSNWVNDLRFSYFFVSSSERAPQETNCSGCLGIDAPAISTADLYIGTSTTTTVLGRRYHLNDVVARQIGTHNLRFGGDWETTRGGRVDLDNQPVTMNLFSPKDVRNYNSLKPSNEQIPLPQSFLTLPDILQLPLENFTVGIGDPNVPQQGFGRVRIAPLVHLFIEDKWHVRSSLTLDFGLGWNFDAPLNYDLAKPAYLAPVLGAANLSPTHRNWGNFSPSAGFAWSPGGDGKTVVRGGAGIYYDFQIAFGIADNERVSLGPRGVGRGTYVGAGIANPLNVVPGVPQGALLDFFSPTEFTGASLLEALPTIRANLTEQRGDPNNRDFSVTNIEVDKQGNVVNRSLPNLSSVQVGIGLQREIARDFVVSGDFVSRHFDHVGGVGLVDVNHFYASRGPVLPLCASGEQDDPQALCSLGPINLTTAIGSGRYMGVLVRAEKRYSRGWQFLGSYAYSSIVGNVFGNGFNNDDPLGNYGPVNTDFHHILALSGLAELPGRVELGFFSTYISRPPFSAVLGGLDLNGDGTTGDLLPGTKVNQFNRGLGKRDLQQLIDIFNKTYAGKKDTNGAAIPLITQPANYEFGDPLLTQDLRLSRNFHLSDRIRLILIGEAFNLFNIANLSGRGNNLLGTGYGQPKSRVTQVFGSGGPRAFQFGARFSF
jgi:Carboxypeptidase regulatory-like domain